MRVITNNTPLRYLVFLGYEMILRDLLDLPTALAHLAATTFYMDDALVQDLLARDAAHRCQTP